MNTDRCLHTLVAEQSKTRPDSIAVRCGQDELTYDDLNRRANQLAHHLQRLGVAPEVPVAVTLESSCDAIVAFLGVLKAGGTFVPIGIGDPNERLESALDVVGAKTLVTVSRFDKHVRSGRARLVMLDDVAIARERDDEPQPSARLHQLALIVGDGRRWVAIEHHALVARAHAFGTMLELSSKDSFLLSAPFGERAVCWESLAVLCEGGKLVLGTPRQLDLTPEAAIEGDITVGCFEPTRLSWAYARHPETPRALAGRLRALVSDGLLADQAALRFFHDHGALIHELYCPLETGTVFVSLGAEPRRKALATVRILDRNQRLRPVGASGELYAGSAGLARGYFGHALATKERFVSDPFASGGLFRTGDLGRWRKDKSVELVGSVRHQTWLDGERIDLDAIEAALLEHPSIVSCAVRARTTDASEGVLVGYVVAPAPWSQKDLDAHLARRLPATWRPSAYVPVRALPYTPMGEIDDAALAEIPLLDDELVARWEERLKAHLQTDQVAVIAQHRRDPPTRWHLDDLLEKDDAAPPSRTEGELAATLKGVDRLTDSPNSLPDWFFRQVWRRVEAIPRDWRVDDTCSLIVLDACGLGEALATRLRAVGHRCITVAESPDFAASGDDHYGVVLDEKAHYGRLLERLTAAGPRIDRVVYLPAYNDATVPMDSVDALRLAQRRIAYGVVALTQALAGSELGDDPVRLCVVTNHTAVVSPEDPVRYDASTLSGLLKSIALEQPHIRPVHVDLEVDVAAKNAALLFGELQAAREEPEVAYRSGKRFVTALRKIDLLAERARPTPLKERGVYLITGGLGKLGFQLARWLLECCRARLLIVGRTALQERGSGEQEGERGAPIGDRIGRYRELEASAREQLIYEPAEVSDPGRVRELVRRAEAKWGAPLDGVFHLASAQADHELDGRTTAKHTVLSAKREAFEQMFRAKVYGTWALDDLLRDRPTALFVCFSSINAVLGGGGLGAYSAANSFLEGMTLHQRRNGRPHAYCIHWPTWDEAGPNGSGGADAGRVVGYSPITVQQGLNVLLTVLQRNIAVSIIGLDQSHPRIRSEWDAGSFDPRELCAYIVRTSGPMSDEMADLDVRDRLGRRTECRQISIDSFPRTARGAIERTALLGLGQTQRGSERARNAPRSDAEKRLPAIWQDILTLEEKRAVGGELPGKQVELQKLRARPTASASIPRVSRTEPLGLSFSQERFLFLQLLEPSSSIYNISAAVQFSGPLDVVALERAFEALIRRHEVMRTTFDVVDGQPVQVIGSPAFRFLDLDLEGLAPAEKKAEFERHQHERATKPFDLLAGTPLLRATIVRFGPEDHTLLFTIHHILFDALSFGPLLGALSEFYNASKEQRAPRLPELTTQFADYAAWQRSSLVGAPLERLLAYWKKQLKGVPSLEIPTDRERPATGAQRCELEFVVLPKELLDEIKLLSRRAGVTAFTTMLSAFEVLLHRYSGQEKFVIGVPILQRSQPEVERLIGCFAHPLALAADLSADPTFLELLKRVHDSTLSAYAHQDLPFEKLVAEIAPERQRQRNPIFQVLLGHHLTAVLPKFLDLEATLVRDSGAATTMGMDLFFNLYELPQGLGCSLDYSSDTFAPATVVRLLRSYEALLKGVVANPDERISALPVLTHDDRKRLLEWNKTSRSIPPELCVHELLEREADRSPDRLAVSFGRSHLTYRELDQRGNQLAHHLRTLGVKSDVTVGVCMDRSLEMVVAIVGILKAGGAYLPLDPEDTSERLASILGDASPVVILTQQVISGGLPDSGIDCICLDTQWPLIAKNEAKRPIRGVTGEHVAHVLYVSGPAGRPVGVVNTHRGISTQLEWMREIYPSTEADRVLSHAPLGCYVSFWETLWPLCSGARLVLAPPTERQNPNSVRSGRKLGIAIVATFTAEPLEDSLAFWSRELQLPFKVQLAGLGQVFQELLDRSSLLSRNEDGINVVLVRFEDWLEAAGGENDLERNVADFVAALSTATTESSTPYVVMLCPASPGARANASWVHAFRRMEQYLQSALRGMRSVHLVVPSEVEHRYPVTDCHDTESDRLGLIPYTPAFFAALGTTIARRIHALRSQPAKVIVLDCDETLWKGVCGEVGPLAVEVDPPRKALHDFMVAQHEAGMLIALCSKNNEADVAEVFEQNSQLRLKREHIVSWRINWSPKSENLRALADELNVGLDSLIFIDDSAVECAEVRANCPDVLVLQLPKEDAAIPHFLDHVWAFDHLLVTEEDKRRNDQYRQNILREHVRKDALTFSEFISGLELKIRITKMTDQPGRVSQLTQRTNQFNVTTIRRTEAEIDRLTRAGELECYVVDVSDRFGDYGLVGAILFDASSRMLEVDTFLLSCRAMGRGVEHRMLAQLGEIARAKGLTHVVVPFAQTKKNEPARQFLEAVGRDYEQTSDDRVVFCLPSDVAAAMTYASADHANPRTDAAPAKTPKHFPDARPARSAQAMRIATELDDVAKFLSGLGLDGASSSRGGAQAAREVSRLVELLIEEEVTTVFLLPDALDVLLRDQEGPHGTTLRRVFSSAELTSPGLQQRLVARLGAELHTFYGSAEVGLAANRQVFLLDAHQQPVPIGAAGEIYIGGDGLAREYLAASELTATRFVRLPEGNGSAGLVYRSGDYGRHRADGTLEYLGRRDDQVTVGGFRVEPSEIETVLSTHHAVDEGVVVARVDESGKRLLIACVVLKERAQTTTLGDLHRFLATRLPLYMHPSRIVVLAAFPRSPGGAIDRKGLPGTAEAVKPRKPFVPPRSDLEKSVVAIWQDMLGVQRIGVHDNFFDLGGQSLLAVRLLSRLKREFGQEIPLSAMFEEGTVEHLCGLIQEKREPNRSVLVPLRMAGSRAPIFFAHSIIATPISYHALSRELGPEQPVYGFQVENFEADEKAPEVMARMAEVYLAELRRIQPHGPYRLAGHSSGGVLALEMAHQLRAQGEDVELLALLDTIHPDRGMPRVDDATFALEADERQHGALTPGSEPAPESAKVVGPRLSLADLDEAARLRMIRIMSAQYRAWQSYRPRTYEGRVVFFRAKEVLTRSQLVRTFDGPEAEWVDVFPNFEIREVPGDHHTMLEAPHVSDLARAIGAMLGT
jgi:FkbH-like protein